MGKSKEEVLADRISDVAAAALALTNGTATAVTIDLAASGEYPYRVLVPDEQLPLVGIATR